MAYDLQLIKIGEPLPPVSTRTEQAVLTPPSAPVPVPVPSSARTTRVESFAAPGMVSFPSPGKRVPRFKVGRALYLLLFLSCAGTISWWIRGMVGVGDESAVTRLEEELKGSQMEIARLKHDLTRQKEESPNPKLGLLETKPEKMSAPRGKVTAKTNPPGAMLIVVGAGSVASPGVIPNVKTGKRVLWVSLEGYDSVEKEIMVEDQKTLDAGTIELSPKQANSETTRVRDQEKKEILSAATHQGQGEGKFTQEEAQLLVRTTEEINTGHSREALQQCAEILKSKPTCLTALVNMGFALIEQTDYESAEEFFRRALALDERDSFLHEMLGSCLFEQHRSDEAVASFNRALALKPESGKPDGSFSYNYLGRISQEKGEMAAAEKFFLKALEINPNWADAHLNLARFYLVQKPPFSSLAQEHYKKARELQIPADPELEKALSP